MTDEMINDFGQSNWVTIENYLGVEICKDSKTDRYFATVWDYEEGENVDVESDDINDIRAELTMILAFNYYESLCEIQKTFKHKADFCNAEQNAENLVWAIREKLANIQFD